MLDPRGERNLTDLLEERAVARGDQTFLVFEDGDGTISELTYDEFAAQVRRCARGLQERGIGPGDRVVVHLRNCPEILIAWFALARLGAVFVPSNVANTAGELVHILAVSAAGLAITQPALLAAVEEAIAEGGSEARIVVARCGAEGHTPFADLLAHGDDAPRPDVGSNEVVELIFTSGTTRKPKAVMLTHSNCLRAGLDAVHCLWLDEGERCLTALPLFHVNAQAMSVMAALTARMCTSSPAVLATLEGTKTAPSRASANHAISTSGQLRRCTTTRSPGPIPSSCRPRAQRRTCAANSS